MKSFLILALLQTVWAQTPAHKTEFEAASVRAHPPQAGFHFSSDSVTGGPGTADPGLFRCTNCSLATLIAKAFDLQSYQFPEKASLGDSTFDVQAKVPEGASKEDLSAMLQNLLKDRFGLAYHFKEKAVRGYHLVVAANGSKLHESVDQAGPATAGEGHAHSGAMTFGASSMYRAQRKSAADIARIVADQINAPVDDKTGLTGLYDVALNWTSDSVQPGVHSDAPGRGDHGDHGGSADPSGATIFQALQTQLGLKLMPAEQTKARIFAIDHVNRTPTSN